MSDNASVSMYAQRRLCSVDALDFPKHTSPPPCLPVFLRIDAWPLQRRPWAPQDARMKKKKQTNTKIGTAISCTQGILGRLEKCHLPSLGPQEPFIILTVGWGGSPEMELTLRKERITYGVPAGVPRDEGPGRVR